MGHYQRMRSLVLRSIEGHVLDVDEPFLSDFDSFSLRRTTPETLRFELRARPDGSMMERCPATLPSFSSSCLLLILSIDSLSAADKLIWIIPLVHYLPDLYPETSDNAIKTPWQTSDKFKEDHDFACVRAVDFWSWIHVHFFDGCDKWDWLAKDIKINAWRVIEFYQDLYAYPKIPKKKTRNLSCILISYTSP